MCDSMRKTTTITCINSGKKHWIYPDNNERQKQYYQFVLKEGKLKRLCFKHFMQGLMKPQNNNLIVYKELLTEEYIDIIIRTKSLCQDQSTCDEIEKHYRDIILRIQKL